MKLVPESVTVVPPAAGPLAGLTPVTVAAWGKTEDAARPRMSGCEPPLEAVMKLSEALLPSKSNVQPEVESSTTTLVLNWP